VGAGAFRLLNSAWLSWAFRHGPFHSVAQFGNVGGSRGFPHSGTSEGAGDYPHSATSEGAGGFNPLGESKNNEAFRPGPSHLVAQFGNVGGSRGVQPPGRKQKQRGL